MVVSLRPYRFSTGPDALTILSRLALYDARSFPWAARRFIASPVLGLSLPSMHHPIHTHVNLRTILSYRNRPAYRNRRTAGRRPPRLTSACLACASVLVTRSGQTRSGPPTVRILLQARQASPHARTALTVFNANIDILYDLIYARSDAADTGGSHAGSCRRFRGQFPYRSRVQRLASIPAPR